MIRKIRFSHKEALKKAEELGKNAGKKELAEVEQGLSFMEKGPVKKIWDKVLFLWNAYKKAEIPKSLKITIIGALLYLILPADLIPDVIPGVGLIDDCTVILLVFNEVSKYLVPKVVEKTKAKLQESYYLKIDHKLKEIFLQKLLNSIITLVINLAGIAIYVVKPAGEYSPYIALGLFGISLTYTLVRLVIFIKQYGKVTCELSKLIFKEKSLSRGVSQFIQKQYPLITQIYAGIDIAQNFIPGLDSVPDFDEIVRDFINHFKKRVILVSLLFILYSFIIFTVKMML